LVVGPRAKIEPLLEGGGQERGWRAGTLNVPAIVGFGAACELAGRRMAEDARRMAALRDRLWRGLVAVVPGVLLNGPTLDSGQRLPGNLNVSIPGVDGDALLAGLERVAVSSGSACSTTARESSHVLRAIGRTDGLARASLRFGLLRTTTEAEIDLAIDEVGQVVARLRRAGGSGKIA
jgi:cysteine desulfurase